MKPMRAESRYDIEKALDWLNKVHGRCQPRYELYPYLPEKRGKSLASLTQAVNVLRCMIESDDRAELEKLNNQPPTRETTP